ncbi:hypothetical protein ACQKPE_07785 [Pseudomonas sp. NPDC089554]|uniref:hypothetical protein n=1 Tax=Pseudomonas sp. NPDC089554 TaxID=3390653 RepID=UPI003D04ABFB
MDRTLDTPAAQPRASYFMRHWRGELSLARAFWVNCILLSLLWLPTLGTEALVLAYLPSATTLLAVSAVLLVGMVVMTTWQCVGVWRSARRYRAPGRMPWGHIVCGLTLLNASYSLYLLIEEDGYTLLKSVWQVWHAPQQIPSHRIALLAPNELGIAGGLSLGSADAVQKLLDAHPAVTQVQLDSDGGLLLEAQRIAKLIQQKGLATYTDGECLSACTLLFQAGKARWLGPDGRLGYHSGALYGTGAQPQVLMEYYRETMQGNGLSNDFITRVLDTPPASMWFPDIDTLRRERIITGLADPADFTDRRLAALREPEQFDAYLRGFLAYRVMEQKTPEAFAALKREISEALGQAKRFSDFNTRNMRRQDNLVTRAMRQAPGAVAMDFWRSELGYLDALEQVGGDACWAYITGQDTRERVPAPVAADRRAAQAHVLEASLPLRADDPPAPRTLRADLDGLFKQVEQRLPHAYEHLRQRDRQTLCAVRQALYREALAMADQERAAAALLWLNGYRR